MAFVGKVAGAVLKAPIHVYRWTLKPLIGMECRHLPTCSEYALVAIDQNGPWRGLWQILARLCRCHPWGSSGFDPVPDAAAPRPPWWAPWRNGRWRLRDHEHDAPGHRAGPDDGHRPGRDDNKLD